MNKLNRKGFTLVELLAVIVVTSLVLALTGYGIISAYNKSKDNIIVLNDKSILEAARIYSTEPQSNLNDGWKGNGESQYFCTTIQRLKNAGLLKKEAKSEKYGDTTIIAVERNTGTLNVSDVKFLDKEEDQELINLCDIKFFTIHYEPNGDNVKNVPLDQVGEISGDGVPIAHGAKRTGYNFTGWKLENSDKIYKPGDAFSYSDDYTSGVITLYAQWEEAKYIVTFNTNGGSEVASQEVSYGAKATKPANPTYSGYNFVDWYTESRLTTKYDFNTPITSNKTLYAKWNPHKVIIKYNVNGGTITGNTTSSNGTEYYWDTLPSGTVRQSVGNKNSYTDVFFTIDFDKTTGANGLYNCQNEHYMNIEKTGYRPAGSSEWKCISDNCKFSQYSQSVNYEHKDFCDASAGDCTVELAVNWIADTELMPPRFNPSDNILSEHWHNEDYSLGILSDNSGDSIKYKVDNGQYQDYVNPIYPSEGIITYTAKATKAGKADSGESTYVSMLDKTAPQIIEIINPTNGNWTNENFKLTIKASDNLSGIDHYEYKYANTEWKKYDNSALEEFTTTAFSTPRNEYVYLKVCDKAGNCSDGNDKTMIRIDKTKPTVSFQMLNGNKVVSGSDYYTTVSSQIPKWIIFKPTLKWTATDADSGVNYKIFSYNRAGNATLDTTVVGSENDDSNTGVYERAIDSDGYRYVNLEVCDKAGNCTNSPVFFKLDKTVPNVPTVDLRKWNENDPDPVETAGNREKYTSGTWSNRRVFTKPSSSDSLSGIDHYEVTVTGASSNVTDHTVTYRNIKAQGESTVKYRACDKAGNCSKYTEAYNIYIDWTPPSKPTISNPTNGNWTNEDIILTVNSSDNLSGLDHYEYKYDSSSSWSGNGNKPSDSSSSITASFSAERNERVYEIACDKAGNCSDPASTYIRIDKTKPSKPTISNPSNGNWTNENIILTVNSSDNLSGLDHYEYKYDSSSSWSRNGNKPSDSSSSITASFSAERNERVYEIACDKAGNCSDPASTYIRIDKTKPTISFKMLNESTEVGSNYYSTSPSNSLILFGFQPTLRWIVTDSGSGVNTAGKYYMNSAGNGNIDETFISSGGSSFTGTNNNGSYYFNNTVLYGGYRKYMARIYDNAGNYAEDTRYFKYSPYTDRYVTSNNVSCRSSESASSSSVTTYSCGTHLTDLSRSYTGNWYYNPGSNCYISGDYLQESKPNCSSGSNPTPGNNNYSVTLHRTSSTTTYTPYWADGYSSESRVQSYVGSMSVSAFPRVNVSPSLYSVVGWRVGSTSNIISSYINYEENGLHLYAVIRRSDCKCSTKVDCDEFNVNGNTSKCIGGVCVVYDNAGNLIGNTCY